MLPRNQIKSRRFNDVMELLADKKFVHQRIQTFGVLEGTTMHVTDVEELLVHFYEDFTKGLLKDIDPRAFVISAYDQVNQVVRGILKDAEEVNRTPTSGIESAPDPSSFYLRRTQCEAGKALHLMGVSLGAQGHFREELHYLNAAVAMKKAALGSDNCLSVSLSDTLHCIGYALDNIGKSRDALDSYSEALIIRRQLLDDNDLRLAETLHNKVSVSHLS
jgi:tetratricopeptide (TPR) repeat protein